jgi:predicted alpha/beta-hydrolase family hydrolase
MAETLCDPHARLINGPPAPAATLLLAHGAGAAMDSPFMQSIAMGLARCGWRVVRFEFPYMARARQSGTRHGPDRQPLLLQCWRDQVALAATEGPLFIGGKSMGGRMASLLVDELAVEPGVRGCVCLGYPFHPPGKPEKLRKEHLAALRSPCLILQGERDAFGRRAEVEGYDLSASIQLGWLPDGDHSFKPTKRSGVDEQANLALAVQLADQFMASCCPDRSGG